MFYDFRKDKVLRNDNRQAKSGLNPLANFDLRRMPFCNENGHSRFPAVRKIAQLICASGKSVCLECTTLRGQVSRAKA
jgi:hypothetical protein